MAEYSSPDVMIDTNASLLAETLLKLNWTEEYFKNSVPYEQCPYFENHWVPQTNYHSHLQYCALRKQGYSKEHIKAMPSSMEMCKSDCLQPKIDWSNETDLLYSRNAEQSSKNNSKLAILAQMRDSKRRRPSYRGIHTLKKSYTEVLRELIESLFRSLQNDSSSIVSDEVQQSVLSRPSKSHSRSNRSPTSHRGTSDSVNRRFYEDDQHDREEHKSDDKHWHKKVKHHHQHRHKHKHHH